MGFTYAVDHSQLVVVKLRYGAGLGVPIAFEAWTCPTATTNLFDNRSSLILDRTRRWRWEGQGMFGLCINVAVRQSPRPISGAYAWSCMCREIAPSIVSVNYLLRWIQR